MPDYKNEYHVKELYLSEFKDLLATGFKHVRVLGQRVNFGSLVAPTDGRATRFATYSRRNGSVRREPGVMKPVYYIALASNAALPRDPRRPLRRHLVSKLTTRGSRWADRQPYAGGGRA